MSNDKFEQHRNRFRRVYAYGSRQPPNIITYTDNLTGLQHQRDLNQIICDDNAYSVGEETLLIFPLPTLFTNDFTTFSFGALVGLLPNGLSFVRSTAETVQTSATTIVTGVAINIPRFG